MSILSGSRVYLAGPIEHSDDGKTWREQLEEELLYKREIIIFNPLKKPEWMPALCRASLSERAMMDQNNEEIINSYDIDRFLCLSLVTACDWVLCRVDSTKTYGTTEEISLAKQLNKPIVVWLNGEWPSTWLRSMLSNSMICKSKQELVETIVNIDIGEEPMNPFLWAALAYTKPNFNAGVE